MDRKLKETKHTHVRRGLLFLLLTALLSLLLSGCGETAPEPVEETPAPVYALRYYLGDKLLQTQQLTEGQYPAHLELSFPGLTFAGWEDAAGKTVRPEQSAMTGDVDYHAVIYPVLGNHVPYLFPDEDGFLHPDAPLTCRALGEALQALVDPAAVAYLPDIAATDEPLTPDSFRETLLALFPAAKVDAACGAYTDNATIARHEAAAILNTLLERTGAEKITLRRGASLAPDIAKSMAHYTDLLEASVSHAVDEWGESWNGCAIPARYAPGFLPLHGKLYCIGEDGAMRADAEIDGFTFGADGVYTSGSVELDAIVTGILADIEAAQPDAEPLDWLRAAYEYARDSFVYFRKAPLTFGEEGWQADYAVEMFTKERGNCYNYAAAFWALARGLGYDARAYSGTISEQPHGWVEIAFDGVDYLFDPELEMAARERGNFGSDRFKMTKLNASFYGFYLRK